MQHRNVFKEHWGCGSCAQQSGPGHPTLPQSYEKDEVMKRAVRKEEQADKYARGQQEMTQRRKEEGKNKHDQKSCFRFSMFIHAHR